MMDLRETRLKNEETNKFEETNSRPTSLYDNFGENGAGDGLHQNSGTNGKLVDGEGGFEGEPNPTQEYLLKTTVPQNLAAVSIAERHTPTRNSLRHSRMIVMNRKGHNPVRRTQPVPIIRCHKLATVLMGFQALLGVVICAIAVWLLLWAPNLPRRDNPHWSGLPLLASGTAGLLLLCCFKSSRPRTLQGYLIDGTKIFSSLLSLVAGAACLAVSVFAIIHLVSITKMECKPSSPVNHSCICDTYENSTHPIKSYHYMDLTCEEVSGTLTMWLIISCVLNATGAFISLVYIYMYCSNRYGYIYSKVRTKDIEMIEMK